MKGRRDRVEDAANADGSAAAVECGTYVRFEIVSTAEDGSVSDAVFQTNGCGFMVAAADVLAEAVRGKGMKQLHGLDLTELTASVEAKLDTFPPVRVHCLRTCIDALRAAFADLRRRRVDEFAGEIALICTCFSVTEETIEDLILNHGKSTVRAIGEACNAGTGCGSCQPVIQDMLDALYVDAV
jgi:NifU-like protein